MKMEGHVKLFQNDDLIHETPNHLTVRGARYILSWTLGSSIMAGYTVSNIRNTTAYGMASSYRIKLGSGAVQPSFDVTTLNSYLIDTPSNSLTVSNSYSTSDQFDVIYTGTITGVALSAAFGENKVNEIGLETYGYQAPTSYRWNTGTLALDTTHFNAYQLVGYISSYGEIPDFDPDLIDTTKTLTVEWRMRVSFAGD